MNTLLDELVELLPNAHRYDRYVSSLCLWHTDHQNSLFVYEDSYKCAACGHFGKTQQLLQQLKSNIIPNRPRVSNNIQQPRNPITRWINVYGSLAKCLLVAYKQLMRTGSVYLTEQRKISQMTCKSLGLGLLDGWYTQPIFNDKKQVIGCTARVGQHYPGRLYMIPAHQSPDMLYITDHKRVKEADKVYLTFGIYDAITLYQLGLAAISTTTGKRLNPEALDHIRKPIIILPDVGEEKEAHRLANELDWRGRVKELPQDAGIKDINEWMQVNPKQLIDFIGA